MSDDFLHKAHLINDNRKFDDKIYSLTLRSISLTLMNNDKTSEDYGLNSPGPLLQGQGCILVDEERAKYDHIVQAQLWDQYVPSWKNEQKAIYDKILQTIAAVKSYTA